MVGSQSDQFGLDVDPVSPVALPPEERFTFLHLSCFKPKCFLLRSRVAKELAAFFYVLHNLAGKSY